MEQNVSDQFAQQDSEKLESVHVSEYSNSGRFELSSINSDLDKRVTRKFDRHVVPWLFGAFLLAFIDRANIGNAKIDGLVVDLKLTGVEFNVALAIFYVPYICVDIPSNLILKHFKAGYYIPFLIISWGLVDWCMGFVKSYAGLLAARFFLGLSEGGLLGGMIIYLAMFYPRHTMMFRVGLFYCAAPLSSAFGGLLATGLARIQTPEYKGWPFIFFVEGAITFVYGFICMYFMVHTPNDAKFLTEEEKSWALQRLKVDGHESIVTDAKVEKFDKQAVKQGILNWNTMLLSLNFFLLIMPIYSFSLFLPTIIEGLGYGIVDSQLLTAPPNMGGFCTVLITCWLSDRYKKRGIFMLGWILVAIAGYIMLISAPNTLIRYGGTFLVAGGIFPCGPLVMGWLANNLAPHYSRAAGMGFQIMFANLAAFIATFTYVDSDAPMYTTGHAINIGALTLALINTTIIILYTKWENKKRDNGERDHRLTEQDPSSLGDRHPSFRYTS